jgi:hypothetical protein
LKRNILKRKDKVKSPQYPFDKRLGRPQSPSECGGIQKIPAPARNQVLVIQPVALSLY